LESAEAAQFKAEMGERVALRKAAAHASAAAALRKVVAAIETSNARQTKKLLTRLATAGEQLTSNRIEIQTLKDELTLLKQQREQQQHREHEGKELPISLPKQTSLYASYQAAD
jgi:Lon protease-like protein